MRRGGRIFIILGLILALIAGAGVFYVLATAEPQPLETPKTALIVAVQNIPSRSEVSADRIQSVDWPLSIPTPIGAYASPSEVVGQLSLVPIYPGQPIVDAMVISKEDAEARHSNAALILERGQVAVAFGVTLSSNVAEAIQAGDRVDLLVTLSPQIEQAGSTGPIVVSQKTLENILILQVGPWPADVGEEASSEGGGGGGASSIITLQMNEQDALTLKHIEVLASNYAFVLRAANDEEIFVTEPVTVEYLNQRFQFNIPGLGQ
jgi:Flp pilus assembly protein CpaB